MIASLFPAFNTDDFIARYQQFKQRYPFENIENKTAPSALLYSLHQMSMINTAWDDAMRQRFVEIALFILKQDLTYFDYIADIVEFNVKAIVMRYSNQLCVSRVLDMWLALQKFHENFPTYGPILESCIQFHFYTGDLQQAAFYIEQLKQINVTQARIYQQEWDLFFTHYTKKTAQPFSFKFTIGILTYGNHADTLEACLASVRERAFYQERIQLFVGNNGSTDQTSRVAQKYKVDYYLEAPTNLGLDLYTSLFAKSEAEFLIELDDDVVELPWHFDKIFEDYFYFFNDYGYLGLNVIENDFIGTEHSKPEASQYIEDIRSGLIVENGPTGGWCACVRHLDYLNINGLYGIQLTGPNGKFLSSEESQFTKKMQLRMKKSGIIQDHRCLHGVKSMQAYQEWLKQQS